MKKAFGKYVAFLVVALGLSIQCFAAQNIKINHDVSQASDNYYVQPGGVYISANGIFVLFNGELTQVNALGADSKGVFVPYEEMNRRFVQCPHCRNWYDPDGEPHRCPGPR